MTLTLYTDFICPFCYIAERSTLERLVREYDVRLAWNGFELHHELPEGGMAFSAMFPGRDTGAMAAHTAAYAKSFGVSIPKHPSHVPNTRKALAAAEYAREQGKLDAFRHAAQDAYWQRGENLENPAVIRALATTVGLNPTATAAAMTATAYLVKVDAARERAEAAGVSGVPTFDFGGGHVVVGCVPYPQLEAAAKSAGARKR